MIIFWKAWIKRHQLSKFQRFPLTRRKWWRQFWSGFSKLYFVSLVGFGDCFFCMLKCCDYVSDVAGLASYGWNNFAKSTGSKPPLKAAKRSQLVSGTVLSARFIYVVVIECMYFVLGCFTNCWEVLRRVLSWIWYVKQFKACCNL